MFAVALVLGTRAYKYRWKAARHRHFASQFAIGSDAERDEATFLQAYLAAKDGSGSVVGLSPRERLRLDRMDEGTLRDRVVQARGNIRTYSTSSRYHTELARRYERAAWFPWLAAPDDSWSVSPDPPGSE
jgi:hypothetical protein